MNFSSIEIAVLFMRSSPLKHSWHMAILDSSVFVGCMCGMTLFGIAGDRWGRVRSLRLTMAVAIVGIALPLVPLRSAPALAGVLLCSRFVVGVGVGGVYPLSAALAYERGKAGELSVAAANFGQPLGCVLIYALAVALTLVRVSPPAAWRAIVVFGATPFIGALILTLDLDEPKSLVSNDSLAEAVAEKPDLGLAVCAASATWFMYNTYAYGVITYYPQLAAAILGHDRRAVLVSNLFAGAAALPFAALSLRHIKLRGARSSVICGATLTAVYCSGLVVVALWRPSHSLVLWLVVLLRGLVQLPGLGVFTQPNTVAPKSLRSRTHGIAAAVGKLGAILGSAAYPVILDHGRLPAVCLATCLAAGLTALMSAAAPMQARHLDDDDFATEHDALLKKQARLLTEA